MRIRALQIAVPYAIKPLTCGMLLVCLASLMNCSKMLAPPAIAFEAPVTYTTGGTVPISAQAADFDGDGKMDLAVANQGSDNVAVLRGNGDGTLQPALTYALNSNGSFPVALAVGDFNRDGKPDIAVLNASSGASVPTVTILLNKGDGTFAPPHNITIPASGQSMAVGDLNGDGDVDLWIGAPGKSFLMLGNGDGTFEAPMSYSTSPNGMGGAMGVAMGDLNNDGKLDLTASNFLSRNVGVLLNTGNDTFSAPSTVPVLSNPAGMTLVDFDHDGNLDIIVTSYNFNSATIAFGAGDGTFGRQIFVAAGTLPIALAAADFDGSGNLALAFANYGGDGITYVAGLPGGTIGETYDFPTGSSKFVSPKVSSVVAADFNGDGLPDIVAVNSGENTVAILITKLP
jgi:FG-GAP-like repeat/FG-GAP repeat